MVTNRQEVAEKLRESGKWLDSGDTGSIREAFYLIEQNIEAPQGREFAPFFDRLADLIDPTCELKIQDGHACCGNCGHRLAGEYEEEEDYWCFRPNCPDCGARVVRDHENA